MPIELFPKKHLFIEIEEQYGEHGCCTSPTLFTVDANVLPEDAAKVAAKNWFGDGSIKRELEDAWEFPDGSLVSFSKVVELPPSDYQTLKRYLQEFEVEIKSENYYAKN